MYCFSVLVVNLSAGETESMISCSIYARQQQQQQIEGSEVMAAGESCVWP